MSRLTATQFFSVKCRETFDTLDVIVYLELPYFWERPQNCKRTRGINSWGGQWVVSHGLVCVSGKEKISVSKCDALNVSVIATACEESYRTGLPVQLSLSSDNFSSGDAGQHTIMNNDVVKPMWSYTWNWWALSRAHASATVHVSIISDCTLSSDTVHQALHIDVGAALSVGCCMLPSLRSQNCQCRL